MAGDWLTAAMHRTRAGLSQSNKCGKRGRALSSPCNRCRRDQPIEREGAGQVANPLASPVLGPHCRCARLPPMRLGGRAAHDALGSTPIAPSWVVPRLHCRDEIIRASIQLPRPSHAAAKAILRDGHLARSAAGQRTCSRRQPLRWRPEHRKCPRGPQHLLKGPSQCWKRRAAWAAVVPAIPAGWALGAASRRQRHRSQRRYDARLRPRVNNVGMRDLHPAESTCTLPASIKVSGSRLG